MGDHDEGGGDESLIFIDPYVNEEDEKTEPMEASRSDALFRKIGDVCVSRIGIGSSLVDIGECHA